MTRVNDKQTTRSQSLSPSPNTKMVHGVPGTPMRKGEQEIATGKLFKHLIDRIWQHRQPVITAVVFPTALAIPVIPIAFLWGRNHMDVGFNAILLVLILPAGIMLAWYAQSATREARRIHVRVTIAHVWHACPCQNGWPCASPLFSADQGEDIRLQTLLQTKKREMSCWSSVKQPA